MNQSNKPQYQGIKDFPTFAWGDTMPVLAVTVKNMDRCEVEIPVSVTASIRGRMHKDTFTLPVTISGEDGKVDFGGWNADQTETLKPQTYDYDVVFVFENGRTRTLLAGTMIVAERVTL